MLAGQNPKELNMYIITLSAGKIALANMIKMKSCGYTVKR